MSAEERAFLLRSLADLEAERAAGDLDDADYADLRTRYERKLASLDDPPSSVLVAVERPNGRSTATRTGRRARAVVTGVIVAGVALGAGVAVAQLSGSRDPGEQVSGSLPATSAEQLQRAAELFQRGEVVEAAKVYDAVLAENPEDVEALTYKGWMLRNVSVQGDAPELLLRAIALLEQATDIDPEYAPAWFFRGIIYLRDEDSPEQAVQALRFALAAGPIPEIEQAARELLAEIAGMTSTTSTP